MKQGTAASSEVGRNRGGGQVDQSMVMVEVRPPVHWDLSGKALEPGGAVDESCLQEGGAGLVLTRVHEVLAHKAAHPATSRADMLVPLS